MLYYDHEALEFLHTSESVIICIQEGYFPNVVPN
jgi:hypothetical protein